MRRLFLLAVIALLLGVGLVALIETEPGYMLLAYGGYTVETSLWVGLVVVASLVLILYATVRFLHRLLTSPGSIAAWSGARNSRQAARLTTRGIISFTEGNWKPARRQLLRGARHSPSPLINYLLAARASHHLGERDRAAAYLGSAQESADDADIAVDLTRAQLQLKRGQAEQARATLEPLRDRARRSPAILPLLCQVYGQLEDWDGLADLLPELRRSGVMAPAEIKRLEDRTAREQLRACVLEKDPVDALQRCWKSLPKAQRQRDALLPEYIELLSTQGGDAIAGRLLGAEIRKAWEPEFVRLFGRIDTGNMKKQHAQARSWLGDHPDDPDLLLCIGRLAANLEQWQEARECFERSHALRPSLDSAAELGRLLIALGEERAALETLQGGIESHPDTLPAPRLPEEPAAEAVPEVRRIDPAGEP